MDTKQELELELELLTKQLSREKRKNNKDIGTPMVLNYNNSLSRTATKKELLIMTGLPTVKELMTGLFKLAPRVNKLSNAQECKRLHRKLIKEINNIYSLHTNIDWKVDSVNVVGKHKNGMVSTPMDSMTIMMSCPVIRKSPMKDDPPLSKRGDRAMVIFTVEAVDILDKSEFDEFRAKGE